jgi:GNAT superfamily N-acetyltransferase
VIDPGSIRVATGADAGTIARIRVDSWRATYTGIVPAHLLEGLEPSAFAKRLAPRLGTPDHGIFVTTAPAGVIRGFVIAAACRDEDAAGAGEIQAIYLAPEARGQGAGGPLLEVACAWLAGQGFGTVVLWVLAANAPARRFYERLRFITDGAARTLDFDGTPIEEIRYRRLASSK